VTDSIQEQSALEPKGAAPEFRYREKAEAALSAIHTLDADLLELLLIQKSALMGGSISLAVPQPYELGGRLRSRFDLLRSEDAIIAGTELFTEYAWKKP
jgi:hypothetical protein